MFFRLATCRLAICGFLACGCLPWTRLQGQTTNDASPLSPSAEKRMLIAANELLGATLLDQQGANVGSVAEVTLGLDDNSVHLIADVGGMFGVGSREIAIPLPAVSLRPADEGGEETVWLSLGISQEKLKQAPTLQARNRLELTDAPWIERNALFYGHRSSALETPTSTLPENSTDAVKSAATNLSNNLIDEPIDGTTARPIDGQTLRVVTVAQLIDQEVVGQGDTATIAYLDDILLGFSSSPLEYAILGYGGTLGIGKDYVAIPFKDITVTIRSDSTEQRITDESSTIDIAIPYNSKTLAEAQQVTPTAYPELRLSSVRKRIDTDAKK